MRILIAIEKFDRGGLETVILDTLNNFKKINKPIEFELLLNYENGELIPFLSSDIKFYILKRSSNLDIKFLFKLRKHLKEKKYDLIHTHSPVIGIFLFISKVGLNIPMVQTIHGFLDKRSSSGKTAYPHFILTYFLTFFISRTIFVSKYLKDEFNKRGFPKRKSITIPNGIDFDKFSVSNPTKLIEDLNSNSIIFGMVGNLNSGRSHTTLIQAFNELIKKNNKVKLFIAGDGELKEDLVELTKSMKIENYVIFLGRINNVADFLNSIDCFVYSSRSDTFGIAVVEALACGIPVIVSDNGPFPNITQNGELAVLFKCCAYEDLFIKMKSFIENPDELEMKAKKAGKIISAKYSIANHIRLLFDTYNSVLSR